MRLASVLLFVAGLALALLGPLVWLGRLGARRGRLRDRRECRAAGPRRPADDGDRPRHRQRQAALADRALASGKAQETVTASLGNLFLLADGTTLRASDATSGRVLWRRPLEGAKPVGTVDPGSRSMAVIDGGLLLTQEGGPMPALRLGDPLQILDLRSANVTTHPLGLSGSTGVYATGTATPGVPLVARFGDTDELVVDGRHFVLDGLDSGEVAATTTQAGFKTTFTCARPASGS